MKKTLLFFTLTILTCLVSLADIPEWENPEIFAINKEATRTTALPYDSEASALADNYVQSPFYLSLNGMWKFYWVPKVVQIPKEFYKEDYDISKWATIPVPGNWEMHGYGIATYVNTGFGFTDFKPNPPYIDKEDSPVGAYRSEFEVPEQWDGRRVFIHFEGGTRAMYLWVNGKQVGYTENAKSPAEFDITSYIRKGKNTLACQVHKFGDATYLEDQDMWRMGGINRDVYLYSTAQTRILDFFAHPDLDSNYKNGIFSIDVTLKNYNSSTENQTISVAILDNTGKRVFSRDQSISVKSAEKQDVAFDGKIPNVLKWTAETPNLYSLLLTLKDSKGNVIEATSHKIGFRKIEIKDGQLFVNGKKILVKGVNVHEFSYKNGQVVSEEEMIRNIQLMKELNVNAVRTSHYPQPPVWYKLCDKYGLYLVDEANLESHGLGYGKDNVSNFPEWNGAHMERIISLVERDKNHASVIFWSLGNEASNGKAFFDMYDWAKARDNSRPVQYEQASNLRNPKASARNTDIICPMYPVWNIMTMVSKTDIGRPYIMCEYAHAMGNSMGNFQEYWDLIRASKNMQGGFIWEWYNQGVLAKDEQGRSYWAYGGDLGGYNKSNDDNFCMDGIISPDQNLIPHSYIVKKVYQNILFKAKAIDKGIITIINDYKFKDITSKEFTYKWILLKNGEQIKEGRFDINIPADSQKDIKLDIPIITAKDGDEYFLQVFSYTKEADLFLPAGFEVAKEEFALSANNYFGAVKEVNGSIEISKEKEKTVVRKGDLVYEFATKDGASLLSMKNKNDNVFNELPKFNFWRGMTDNDVGENAHLELGIWEHADYNMIYKFKGSNEREGSIAFVYEAKIRAVNAKINVTYTVNKDGSLTIASNYLSDTNELPEIVRFGMIMTLPRELNDFTWYGRGPGESYVDRKYDMLMGIWNGKVEDQAFHYYRPQETGNKMDVRWLTLKDQSGYGIRIDGCQPIAVSATNNKPEDLYTGKTKKQQHWSDVKSRKETVLCVDLFQRGLGGITSWRTKPLDNYRFTKKEYNYSYTISIVE